MTTAEPRVRVLFVCMGNICRSPTAHAVFRQRLREAGLDALIEVESAGTHGYHVGSGPDRRAQEAARARGYDLSDLRARKAEAADLAVYDYVLAMDEANLADLQAMAGPERRAELALFLAYAGTVTRSDVPDPYYGGANGFEEVLDLVEAASEGLLAALRTRHGL